jgi:hypothetical protein
MNGAEQKSARAFIDDYDTVSFTKDKTKEQRNLLMFQILSGLVSAGHGNYAFMSEERIT